jgi:hypothetical protein
MRRPPTIWLNGADGDIRIRVGAQTAALATHGLMLWDGQSRGTLTNIRNLVTRDKPTVVYVAPTKTFVTVRTSADIEAVTTQASLSATSAAS